MKVAIEARALAAAGGVHTYTQHLIRALAEGHAADLTIITPEHSPLLPTVQQVVVPLRQRWLVSPWLQRHVPRAVAQTNAEVVHYTKGDVPVSQLLPTVVTIHDIIPILFPAGQSPLKRWYWSQAVQRAVEHSDHIVAVSAATKSDLIQHFKVPSDRITVSGEAAETEHFKPVEQRELTRVQHKYQLTKPYLLFVSTIEPRKNIPGLLRIFQALESQIPHELVIVGKLGGQHREAAQALQRATNSGRVKWLNYVDYADLPALYTGADLVVLPSIYEGWGLPVQEALACGSAVVVSNGGALPEVVGEAGVIVPFTAASVPERLHDAAFERAFGQAIVELLTDSVKLTKLRSKAREQALRFSWTQVAEITWQVYKKVSHAGL